MENDYEFLVEKEEMWANVLIQVLKDNDIPCAALPTYGAGMVMRTGMQEYLKLYVPKKDMAKSTELLHQLFAEENT